MVGEVVGDVLRVALHDSATGTRDTQIRNMYAVQKIIVRVQCAGLTEAVQKVQSDNRF